MDTLASLNEINYLAVIVAAVVGFGIGALWYAPAVLGKRWMQLTGRMPEKATGENTHGTRTAAPSTRSAARSARAASALLSG